MIFSTSGVCVSMALLRMTHLFFLKLLLLPNKYIISIFPLQCVCVLSTLLQLICLFSSLSLSKTIPVLLSSFFFFFHSHPWGYNRQLSLCMVRLATSAQFIFLKMNYLIILVIVCRFRRTCKESG